ncbi:MAG: hypothetical protein H6506_00400 [Calditrichaeota bacterium]|nr:hypothetical protein [Calditrichota bacterium]MCB9391098.1 hypothetical protein [Calditrichota bacterium]
MNIRPWVYSLACIFGMLTMLSESHGSQSTPSVPPTPANFWEFTGPEQVQPMPFEVVEPDPSAVHVRFFDPVLNYSQVEFENQSFTRVSMPAEGTTTKQGEPDLPRVSKLIMVNRTGEVRVTVTNSSFTTMTDIDAAPKQPYEGEELANSLDDMSFAYDNDLYAQDAWYPQEIAVISTPATLRDVRFVSLSVAPVQFNPARRELRIYDNIEVAIEDIGGIGENEIVVNPEFISPSFKKLYRSFENFAGSSLDELPTLPGKYLVICPNNATNTTEAQRLVDWHRRKGLDASYVTLTTTGSTATNVRDYISSQYVSSNGALEFVCMMGDPGGGATFATPTGNGSQGYDNYLGVLSPSGGPNSDPVPDIAVGRISSDEAGTLTAMVTKTINYEANPYTGDPGWFTRAHCTAHTAFIFSNPSMKEYVRQIMLQAGQTCLPVQVLSGSMSESLLNAILSSRPSMFNHRMSWIGETPITALQSAPAVGGSATVGGAMPFVYAMTCGTGDFTGVGQDVSEEWVQPPTQTNSSPRGAIGCVGLLGISTHVPYNNILDAGAMYGLYVYDIHEMGLINISGKLELYKNYQNFEPQEVINFCYWANLMGDPATKIWTNFPNTTTVSHPVTISRGTNNVTISVSNPLAANVEGAQVCLLKGTETFARGYTDANGQVNLPIATPTTGSLLVTVTKDDQFPYLGAITVNTVAANLTLSSVAVDDDNLSGTIGNNDDVLNPGETIDLSIVLTNTGTNTVTGITGNLTSTAPGVTIVNGSQTYPNIASGGTGSPVSPYRIHVSSVFNAEPVALFLNLTTAQGNFTVRADFTPAAPDVAYSSFTFGGPGGNLNPDESGTFTPTITNTGTRPLIGADGILRSLDPRVSVTDSVGIFGTINSGANGNSSSNTFAISISSSMFNGHIAPMQLVVYDDNGFRDSTDFNLTIGSFTSTSPSGPDAYGYYAFDNTETQNGIASNYEWIEIAPLFGGSGTSLNMSDLQEDDDDTQVLPLPFDFTFYGQTYDSVTICCNGWLAFGNYPTIIDFRNYRMGSPIGPPSMVAAYWDDLYMNNSSGGSADSLNVFYYYDSIEHYYVVEWRAHTQYSDVREIFEVIIYDPAFYPSGTGDGKVKVQYNTVNLSANSNSNDNDYASVGIQNFDHSTGLDYYYWNQYGPGAASLVNGRSILYTTDDSGQLNASVTLNAPNGGETYYLGQSYNILWQTTAISGNVGIELMRSYPGGTWETLVTSTPNDGVYSWTASGAASTTSRLRVYSVAQPAFGDSSDANFQIAVPLVQVQTPNGGELLTPGEPYGIAWTSTGLGPASVEVNRDYPGGSWELLSSSASDGYQWMVTGPATNNARIRIKGIAYSLASDESNASFSIGQVPVLTHKQQADQAAGPATLIAHMVDDLPGSTVIRAYYRLIGGGTYDSVSFTPTGNQDEYSVTIATIPDGSYEYYVSAVDQQGLSDRVPDAGHLTFDVGDVCVPWISYDDGTAENYNWVDGPGFKWAVYFDPGTYPFNLCAAQFAVNPVAPTDLKGPVVISVQLADGPGGNPGTLVLSDTTGTVNAVGGLPAGAAWSDVVFGSVPVSGPFYVVVENLEPRDCPLAFGLDTSTPSGNSFFYDECDAAWYPETAAVENARAGNRMIRVSGFNFVAPTVTIQSSGNNVVLRWESTGAPFYRVYASASPEGPYDTFVGSTSSTSYTHTNIIATETKYFYVVVSSSTP